MWKKEIYYVIALWQDDQGQGDCEGYVEHLVPCSVGDNQYAGDDRFGCPG